MENKYFYKVGYFPNPLNDDKAEVELWSGWNGNINQDSREETVATIASLSYGNEQAKNPSKLYKRLQELKHESVFEFINMPPFDNNRISESLRHEKLPYFEDYNDIDNVKDQLILEHKASVATFKIKCPLIVARQFMRHRASYLEMSRRYVKNKKVPFEFYDFWENLDLSRDKIMNIQTITTDFYKYSVDIYETLLNLGVPAEKARCVIPQGAYTVFWVQMDIDYLANFFLLRLKKDAQEEIRNIAYGMWALIQKFQPDLFVEINKKINKIQDSQNEENNNSNNGE